MHTRGGPDERRPLQRMLSIGSMKREMYDNSQTLVMKPPLESTQQIYQISMKNLKNQIQNPQQMEKKNLPTCTSTLRTQVSKNGTCFKVSDLVRINSYREPNNSAIQTGLKPTYYSTSPNENNTNEGSEGVNQSFTRGPQPGQKPLQNTQSSRTIQKGKEYEEIENNSGKLINPVIQQQDGLLITKLNGIEKFAQCQLVRFRNKFNQGVQEGLRTIPPKIADNEPMRVEKFLSKTILYGKDGPETKENNNKKDKQDQVTGKQEQFGRNSQVSAEQDATTRDDKKQINSNNNQRQALSNNISVPGYIGSTSSLLANPDQITQQLVKQNLMIFNRKNLVAGGTTNSAAHRISQLQRQKNNFLIKQQASSLMDTYQPQSTLNFQMNSFMGENDNLLTNKSSQQRLQTNQNSETVSTKLLLSKNILGIENSQGNKEEYMTEESNNKALATSQVIAGPPKQNKKQINTEQPKLEYLSDILTKNKQTIIPPIEVPCFKNNDSSASYNSRSTKHCLPPKPTKMHANIKQIPPLSVHIAEKQPSNIRLKAKEMISPSNQQERDIHFHLTLPTKDSISHLQDIIPFSTEEDTANLKNTEESKLNWDEQMFGNSSWVSQCKSENDGQQQIQTLERLSKNPQIEPKKLSRNNTIEDTQHETSRINVTRPMTAAPTNKEINSNIYFPISMHQHFLSKILSTERNQIFDRLRQGASMAPLLTARDYIDETIPPLVQDRVKSSGSINEYVSTRQPASKDKRSTDLVPPTLDTESAVLISPWQNENQADLYSNDDSQDFIQYTTTSPKKRDCEINVYTQ